MNRRRKKKERQAETKTKKKQSNQDEQTIKQTNEQTNAVSAYGARHVMNGTGSSASRAHLAGCWCSLRQGASGRRPDRTEVACSPTVTSRRERNARAILPTWCNVFGFVVVVVGSSLGHISPQTRTEPSPLSQLSIEKKNKPSLEKVKNQHRYDFSENGKQILLCLP